MPKPDPLVTEAPGKIALLAQRERRLERALKKAKALPAISGDAKKRMDKLVEQIDFELRVVQYEKSLREQYLKLSEDSAKDKDPGFFSKSSTKQAWKDREKKRADDRKALAAKIEDLPNKYPKSYPKTDIANPCIKCHTQAIENEIKRVNKLTKVELLHGFTAGDDTGKTDPVLGAEATQWVNLAEYRTRFERKALPAWLTPGFGGKAVDNFDRLSRSIRIRLTFANPGAERFEVLLVCTGGDAGYTATEAAAHSAYRVNPSDSTTYAPIWAYGTTDDDGKAVVTLSLRAAGGETWKVKGRDDYGTVITAAGSLKTRRGLFVTTMTMNTVTPVALADAKAEFVKQEIYLETDELTYGTAGKLPFSKFMFADSGRINTQIQNLKDAARPVFDDSTFRGEAVATLAPYLILSVFYNKSPSYATTPSSKTGAPTAKMTLPLSYYLWTKDDPDNSWLVSARVQTKSATGEVKSDWPAPTAADFETGVEPTSTVRFKPNTEMLKAAELTIEVEVLTYAGGINGFSSGNQGQGALVAIARSHFHMIRDAAEMNQTIVHELGHKTNYTTGPEPPDTPPPTGTAAPANLSKYLYLDASPFHYVARGHQGGHCYYDATPNAGGVAATALVASFSLYSGKCVMFGAGNSRRAIAFCATCAERVKKGDLETGWTSL